MKKVCLHTDKYLSRVKLYEETPQEDMEDFDNFFSRVKNAKYLYCPYKENHTCGSSCAWFDIEEEDRDKRSPDGSFLITETYKVITCKGTPIGELVEEEVGE